MYLEIVTPDKKVFEGEVSSVVMPGIDGGFEVLNSHAALISALGKGLVRLKSQGGTQEFMIDGGLVEVLNNRVSLLAEGISI
jgi:F-type H+-transporting ATPase subunit epsilon